MSFKTAWNYNIEMLGQCRQHCSSPAWLTGEEVQKAVEPPAFSLFLTLLVREPRMSSCLVHWFGFVWGICTEAWGLFYSKAVGLETAATLLSGVRAQCQCKCSGSSCQEWDLCVAWDKWQFMNFYVVSLRFIIHNVSSFFTFSSLAEATGSNLS